MTKRIIHRKRPGTNQAREILERLSEDETREALRLTEEQIRFLDNCAAGRPPRNAQSGIAAIKLKLDFSQTKPKQDVNVSGAVSVVVVDPYAEPAGDE